MTIHQQELLEKIRQYFTRHALEHASVADICRSCRTSTRTFYNYFYDKYDAASRVVLERMRPLTGAPLSEWHEELADFNINETSFLCHCIETTDSNPFLKTLKRLEYEKLAMHIPEAVMEDLEQAPRIQGALLFFTHGLVGTMYTNVVEKEGPIDEKIFNTVFDNNWAVVQDWLPDLLKKTLTDEVQREASPELTALLTWKCDREA